MLKKKRYRKYTLGRLQLFFQKEPYIGVKCDYKLLFNSNVTAIDELEYPSLKHYTSELNPRTMMNHVKKKI
jgi:hypothetical protein